MIEFLHRSLHLNILGIEPYESSRFKIVGNGRVKSIGRDLILRLADSYLFTAIVVKFTERSQEVVCVCVTN
jgi:hypothetical protein